MKFFEDRVIEHNGHVITAKNERRCYAYIHTMAVKGATSREIEEFTGRGHGSISGALSELHAKGAVACLTKRRDGQRIYVLPEFVRGRDTVTRHAFHCKCCRYRVEGE
jgi:hypothetical protein